MVDRLHCHPLVSFFSNMFQSFSSYIWLFLDMDSIAISIIVSFSYSQVIHSLNWSLLLVTSCSGNWWKHVPQGRVISLSQHLLACVGGTLVGGPSDLDIYLWEHAGCDKCGVASVLHFYNFFKYFTCRICRYCQIFEQIKSYTFCSGRSRFWVTWSLYTLGRSPSFFLVQNYETKLLGPFQVP